MRTFACRLQVTNNYKIVLHAEDAKASQNEKSPREQQTMQDNIHSTAASSVATGADLQASSSLGVIYSSSLMTCLRALLLRGAAGRSSSSIGVSAES